MLSRMRNRATAWIITVLVVLFAALLGGRASLNKLRTEAWELFAGGGEDSYASVDYDLGEIAANAYNLLTVAERYVDSGDILMESLRADADIMMRSPALATRRASAENLKDSVAKLNALLETLPLSEADQAYRNKLTVNIESRYKTIANSGYNTAATAFNKELDRMPASLIASVTDVPRLELYQ